MDFFENELKSGAIISVRKNNLYIGKSRLEGNGVFSDSELKKGDVIECCPLLVFSQKDADFLQHTSFYNYYFLKHKEALASVLALGFGSLYNHEAPSNAQYELDLDQKKLTITAVCTIAAGVEITINYNGPHNSTQPVAFVNKNEVYEFSVNLF